MTPLMEAISTGHGEFITPLLTYGADVALKDQKGRTAGDIAKQKGYQDAIVLLTKP